MKMIYKIFRQLDNGTFFSYEVMEGIKNNLNENGFEAEVQEDGILVKAEIDQFLKEGFLN